MRAIWRILAALIALCADPAPAAAADAGHDPRPGDAQPFGGPERRARRSTGGLRWRVFAAQRRRRRLASADRRIELAQPTLTIPPGDYVVHVAFGLASATKRVTLGPEVRSERLTLSAGALRIGGTLARRADRPLQARRSRSMCRESRNPLGKLVYAKAKAGDIDRPAGRHLPYRLDLSRHGRRPLGLRAARRLPANPRRSAPPATLPTNSIVNADIKVASGKLVDVTLRHRCATLTLKLVNKPGGEALANTTFTVLTPGGDVIRELIGAFPSLVLAEGEYVVIARHDAKTYQSTFQVQSGMDRDVEVIAQESDKQGP